MSKFDVGLRLKNKYDMLILLLDLHDKNDTAFLVGILMIRLTT